MKLYELNLVLEHPPTRFPLTLEGSMPLVDEGNWSVPKSAVPYLGQTSGFWNIKSVGDGGKEIWMWEDDHPNFISFFWRRMPFTIAHLEGILKMPLSLGETGTGMTLPLSYSKFSASKLWWKVVSRGF